MPAPPHPPFPEAAVRAAVAQTLRQIAPEVDLTAIPDTANLRRECDLDSVDFQNFVIGLGKSLQVVIADRDAAELVTLAGCLGLLAHRPSATTD